MAPFWRENQLVQTKTKKTKKESSQFEEPRCKLVSKARSNSTIQFASHKSKLVVRNFDFRSAPFKVAFLRTFVLK
jgi:hypothetical protein